MKSTNLVMGVCIAAGFAGLIFLSGCSTAPSSEYKPGTNFGQYRTFAVMPLRPPASTDDPGLIMRVAEPAKAAVVSELSAKGLKEESINAADLAVNIRGHSLPKVEVRDYGYSYPVMTRAGMVTVVHDPYTTVSTYQERTLVIEMLDTRTKEVTWIGWLKKESSRKVTPEDLQEAIRTILSQFPPAPEKK